MIKVLELSAADVETVVGGVTAAPVEMVRTKRTMQGSTLPSGWDDSRLAALVNV